MADGIKNEWLMKFVFKEKIIKLWNEPKMDVRAISTKMRYDPNLKEIKSLRLTGVWNHHYNYKQVQ